MSVKDQIEKKLRDAFKVTELKVVDESHLHAGHAGAREGGESHFRVYLTAADFADMGRVERQRQVNHVLAEELAGPVHALALKLDAP